MTMTSQDSAPVSSVAPAALETAEIPDAAENARLEDLLRRERDARTPDNTRRAYRADLRYWDAWFEAWRWWAWLAANPDADPETAPAFRLPFPTPAEIVRHFIAQHLSADGPPKEVDRSLVDQGMKRAPGAVKPPTVERRLAALTYLHRSQGHHSPARDPAVRQDLALFRRGYRPTPKSPTAGTRDLLAHLVDACAREASAIGRRDAAVIMVMYASGGRRRSELGRARLRDLTRERTGFRLLLWGTKTRKQGEALSVPIKGTPARALARWIAEAGLEDPDAALFPPFDQWGRMKDPRERGLGGPFVNRMIQRRAAQAIAHLRTRRLGASTDTVAALDRDIAALEQLSAHGVRAGYLTDAMRQRIPRKLAQQFADIRSPRTLDRYERAAEVMDSEAGDLWDV